MTSAEHSVGGAGRRSAGATLARPGRRWEELEDRGRALLPEASCKVDEWGFIGVDWLASASQWLAGAGEGGWEELVGTRPNDRSYRRIAASPHVEAWLIFWPQGGRLQMHDHGGASGALTVVTGALDERYLPGGRGPARHRQIEVGEGVHFDGHYIHDVRNPRPAPATSVHVYNSAGGPMRFYDLDGGLPRRSRTTVDEASIVEHGATAGD